VTCIKTIYIAGPLTPHGEGNHAIEYLKNVHDMVEMACHLMALGFDPFVPALDMTLFIMYPAITEERIKDYSMEWLRRCDAVFDITENVEHRSGGVLAEIREAERLGIPVFRTVEELFRAVPE